MQQVPRRRRLPPRLSLLLAGLAAPRWDLRTFFYGLIALIILVLFINNWAPVRIDLLGWKFQWPLPIFFIVSLVLGAVLLWLWQLYGPRGGDGGEQE